MEDMVRKGRSCTGHKHWSKIYPEKWIAAKRKHQTTAAKGEHNAGAKVTAEIATAVYRAITSGEPISCVANAYGLSRTQIYRIKHRQSWRHLFESVK